MKTEQRLELEAQILSVLLAEPKAINTVDLDGEYFIGEKHRDLFNTLYILNGQYASEFELYDRHKDMNPESRLEFEDIYNLKESFITSTQLTHHADLLKKQHFEHLVKTSSEALLEEFTVDNRITLQNNLQRLENVGRSTDAGDLKEASESVVDRLYNKPESGIKTYTCFDYLFGDGISAGALVTIAGQPSVGKSTFGVNNLVGKALMNTKDLVVDIFSLEMTKEEVLTKFASTFTKINSTKITNGYSLLSEKERKIVTDQIKFFNEAFDLKIYDDIFHLEDIQAIVRRRALENKDKKYMVVLDHLNILDTRKNFISEYSQISHITRNLKVLAGELNITVIMLSQMNRGVDSRQDKKPMMSDLRGSGSIEQDSSAIMFLWYDNEDEKQKKVRELNLTVAKNRHGPVPPTLKFDYYPAESRIEERY